jgi:hypothetical protein
MAKNNRKTTGKIKQKGKALNQKMQNIKTTKINSGSNSSSSGKTAGYKPGPVFVTNGSFKGEVYLQWDAVKEANHYAVQLSKKGTETDKGETGWLQIDIISDPCYSMQGLKSGRSYSFRVSAIFSCGQGPWSEAVTKKIK